MSQLTKYIASKLDIGWSIVFLNQWRPKYTNELFTINQNTFDV
jgi:hypothetical protein